MKMYKSILIAVVTALLFNACVSTKILRFGELDTDVANQDEIINNYDGDILTLEAQEDLESMTVLLPKDNMTLRVRIKVANIEDVLYMNIVNEEDFSMDKILRRVSSLDELDTNQDGWMFEPSVEKGVITMQLYLPSVYLYSSQYNPKLLFSYKRSARALQESIVFHFVKQNYFPTFDEDEYEMGKYDTLEEYCKETGKGVNEEFRTQIELLNKQRVSSETIDKLNELCN